MTGSTVTRDVVFATGPTRELCIEAAVEELVSSAVDARDATPTGTLPVAFGPGTDDELLTAVVDQAVSVLEIFGLVPLSTSLEPVEGGGLSGSFETASLDQVRVLAAVSLRGATFDERDGTWSCHVALERSTSSRS